MLISWAGLKRKVNIVNYIYYFHLITSEDRDGHYRPQKSKLAGLAVVIELQFLSIVIKLWFPKQTVVKASSKSHFFRVMHRVNTYFRVHFYSSISLPRVFNFQNAVFNGFFYYSSG